MTKNEGYFQPLSGGARSSPGHKENKGNLLAAHRIPRGEMHRHSPKTHPRPDRGALASLVYFIFPSQQQNIGGGAGAGSSSSGGVASGPVSLRSHARGRVSPRSHGAVSHGHSGGTSGSREPAVPAGTPASAEPADPA